MKKLLVLVVLVVLVIACAFYFAGAALEKGIEAGGTWALGTKTKCDKASLGFGTVKIEDLKIKSPEGFKSDAFQVDEISAKAQPMSLLSDTIEIDSIDIKQPEVGLEFTANGTNIGALLKNLEARRTGAEPPSKPSEKVEKDSKKPSKNLHIGRITITTPRVKLEQSMLLATSRTITLPTIELTDLGGTKGTGDGKTQMGLPELIEQVLGAIMAAVVESGQVTGDLGSMLNQDIAADFLKNVKGDVGKVGDEIRKSASATLDEMKGKAQQSADELRKKAEELKKKGLGGLLGGEKKD